MVFSPGSQPNSRHLGEFQTWKRFFVCRPFHSCQEAVNSSLLIAFALSRGAFPPPPQELSKLEGNPPNSAIFFHFFSISRLFSLFSSNFSRKIHPKYPIPCINHPVLSILSPIFSSISQRGALVCRRHAVPLSFCFPHSDAPAVDSSPTYKRYINI